MVGQPGKRREGSSCFAGDWYKERVNGRERESEMFQFTLKHTNNHKLLSLKVILFIPQAMRGALDIEQEYDTIKQTCTELQQEEQSRGNVNHAIVLFLVGVLMSPFLHVTISPCHHFFMSPFLRVTISSCHHFSMSPFLHVTISPCHHLSM